MNHIELFAGCGGLSLGLETAGFDLLLANELSPMASETFAFNHLNADLSEDKNTDKILWISSKYDRQSIMSRLRENPQNAAGLTDDHISDVKDKKLTSKQLKRGLLVGSIIDLNEILMKDASLSKKLRKGLGEGEVDLVSGGPPCQSFSLAGLRQHTNDRNQLPWEFAKFVSIVRPKIALLENVSGILRAFKIGETKYYAWFEVAKAFAKIGYIPLCLHVNAKYVGTAQNRPRFILIAIRDDIYEQFEKSPVAQEIHTALEPFKAFYAKVYSEGADPQFGSISYLDIERNEAIFSSKLLSPLSTHDKSKLISVKDAIDDLRSARIKESEYIKRINSVYKMHHNLPLDKLKNHDLRSSNNKVKSRFRLYQIMSKLPKDQSREITDFLRSEGASGVLDATLKSIGSYWLLDDNGRKIENPTKNQTLAILNKLYTKKQTQKALKANDTAPAALSIPDDACHYHESVKEQRTLTVREMTRIQSFPDWYEIKSKVTTGGQMRKFEVPQYTQIGNAVPPLLGIALGQVCRTIIDSAR